MNKTGAPTYPVSTIAKLLLLSERRVQQLTKEGVIPKAERGRYELAPAVQARVLELWDQVTNDNINELTDFAGYKKRLPASVRFRDRRRGLSGRRQHRCADSESGVSRNARKNGRNYPAIFMRERFVWPPLPVILQTVFE